MKVMVRQILRFLITGSITTSLSYIIFLILFRCVSVNYLISSATGYVAGIFLSYLINKRWTFEDGNPSMKENISEKIDNKNRIQIIKYFSVYIFFFFF